MRASVSGAPPRRGIPENGIGKQIESLKVVRRLPLLGLALLTRAASVLVEGSACFLAA